MSPHMSRRLLPHADGDGGDSSPAVDPGSCPSFLAVDRGIVQLLQLREVTDYKMPEGMEQRGSYTRSTSQSVTFVGF